MRWFLTISLIGCGAQHYLHGADIAREDFAMGAQTSFVVAGCYDQVTHQPTFTQPATYHVINYKGEVTFFERDLGGRGSIFTNQWDDDHARHFFEWVKTRGWEVVWPRDGTRVLLRLYFNVDLQDGPDGSTRPNGAPSSYCELVVQGSAPSQASAPGQPAAAPTTATQLGSAGDSCVKTSDCETPLHCREHACKK